MKKMETDLVIIGCGTSGLAAGLTAMENGVKNVILLEKKINYGGNSSMAGGQVFAAGNRSQKKAGKVVDKDKECQRALADSKYDRVNPILIRNLINRSGETFDWLEDQGLKFHFLSFMPGMQELIGKFTEEIEKTSKGVIMQYSLAMETLANRITEKGGQILLRTAARKILRDENGAVSGVVAATRDGEEIQIKCRTVVLSSGGFTGNKELLKKYFGYDDFATEAVPLMGDGIKLADEAGAYLEEYATMCEHGLQAKYVKYETMKNQPNRHIVTGPWSIMVNSKGQRYIDSGSATGPFIMGGAKLLFRQPGKVAYTILDDKILHTPIPENIMTNPGGEVVHDAQKNAERVKKELLAAAGSGPNVCVSDDWSVIARYIGAKPEVLKATIDEYNSYCDRGVDEVFGKDKRNLVPMRNPPYYAVEMQAMMVEAIGPVRINERMEVLDKQEEPIPGFYAAGAITSGWCGHNYLIGGSNLGFGTTGGRIAGENAAKYIATK